MGARGRRGFILGMKDLSEGLQLLDSRKQKRLADAFAREQFDYRKDQDAAEEKRLSEALAAQIANQEADNARAKSQYVLGAADKMRARMLENGRLDLGEQRETRLAKMLSLRGTGDHNEDRPTEDDKVRDRIAGLSRYINEKLVAMPHDQWGDPEAEAKVRAEAERLYRGASPLDAMPVDKPPPAADPYATMDDAEWKAETLKVIEDMAGDDDEIFEAIMSSPKAQALKYLPPAHRLTEIMKIRGPNYFIEPQR